MAVNLSSSLTNGPSLGGGGGLPPLSLQQLLQCFPNASKLRAGLYLDGINHTMQQCEINTPQRQCYFLAQIGHESGELRYSEEIASGKAYEGRLDLGNTQPGDGCRYKGRGLIQLTGKRNYALAALALNQPLLEKPELLSTPTLAALCAGWFWTNNKLNSYADKGDFSGLTRRINGGLNGLEDRQRLLKCCQAVIK
jgi:putative chitinase